MLLALCILVAGALLLIPLENWVHRNLRGVAAFLAEHVYVPTARTLVLVGFLVAIYPSPLIRAALVPAGWTESLPGPYLNSLLNWMFLAGVLLPTLPGTERFAALILPIQTLIGAWLLIAHFAEASGQILLSPPLQHYLLLAAGGLAAHMALTRLANRLHGTLRLDALTLYDSFALVLMPPLVLLLSREFHA